MKAILTVFFLLPIVCFAQPREIYEDVVQVDSLKKEALFYNAKRFFIDKFTNLKQGILTEDKDQGLITAKAKYWLSSGFVSSEIIYTIEVQVKDGRYKYLINDIATEYSVTGFNATSTSTYKELLDSPNRNKKKNANAIAKIDAEINNVIALLKKAMIKPVKDW